MDKKILWQKWTNPYEIAPDDLADLANLPESNIDDIDDDIWRGGVENEQPDSEKYIEIKSNTKAMFTPMGVVPINEHTPCTKTFKFWIGHTNFNLSKNLASVIEQTSGVETLDIFTRYRFRIGIGKAFRDRDVMSKVQENLYAK